jgi:putative intracellular protease/amidase
MRKSMVVFAVLVLCGVGGLAADAGAGGRVLLIPREGESADLDYMLAHEVGVMVSTLEQAGYEVTVGSASGDPIKGTEHALEVDLKLADVDVGEYDGLIMPCMAVEADPAPEAIKVVKRAVAQGVPVAAQYGSVYILGAAGVLSERRFALYEQPEGDEAALFAGATYAGNGIVQDGAIITSGICSFVARDQGLPDGTPGLTSALIAEMSR